MDGCKVSEMLIFLSSSPVWGRVIHIPDPVLLDEWFSNYPGETEEETEPSYLLSSLHMPNTNEVTAHQLSRSLLRLTKDFLSFSPRSKLPDKRSPSIWEKLSFLQTLSSEDVDRLLSQQGISILPLNNITCHPATQYYRTLDGSCNNLQHPCWGKADEPYQRWLPPAYADGIDEPRQRADGHPLPNPRLVYQWVASQFQQTTETEYPHYTNLLMAWGQMIAHDMTLTPTVMLKIWNGHEFKDEPLDCCEILTTHPDCIPIVMNYRDGFYSQGHCMNVVRSVAYTYSPISCQPLQLGLPREQMNQLTSFIDASLVYGTTEEEMRKLREDGGQSAKLIADVSTGWSYMARKNKTCKSAKNICDKRCFLAGEKRANENPVLSALHTLWVREHNRLVDVLRVRRWPEETLFYVVRKIVGALLQHITYNEYLPIVLGTSLMDYTKLSVPTPQYEYNPSINPTLYNVFITAAFRYGHSMIGGQLKRQGKFLDDGHTLSNDYFSMDDFCSPQEDPVAALLSGQTNQKCQKVDNVFSKQVTNHLFAKQPNGEGLDLFSINVQRGRDHGLPPYNKWRETCGLPKANDYWDLRSTMPGYVIERLQTVYGAGGVDEVDLFVAGVSEFSVNGGILGPTFTCIVANQFKNLKFGDRFWYENTNHPGAFTHDQIKAIQKNTFSSLLCRNSDIKEIQQMAFITESAHNPKLPCSTILQGTDLDINLWP
ncbi:peroxidase-like isoform X2 [Stegodyphus dumicola]|uniref:peroxidase-like isoform X2 n=1 Tax=Stegodyphus dumicola TaxID=202533 RepID=UPI0015A7C264|nr:peroxidase-like isoform X2 [Stegodyphus dumicola]